MTDITPQIRSCLETHLKNASGLPYISYENISYEPDGLTNYIDFKFVPTYRKPACRGTNPPMKYQGIFRVFCYSPQGLGPGGADDIASAVINLYESTTDISYTDPDTSETIIISIDYAERDQGFTENSYYYVTVNVGWYIYH